MIGIRKILEKKIESIKNAELILFFQTLNRPLSKEKTISKQNSKIFSYFFLIY
jgi:hypothetical protein